MIRTDKRRVEKVDKRRRGLPALVIARPILDPACLLDREADALLARGRHAEAERLSHRAAEMRGWA